MNMDVTAFFQEESFIPVMNVSGSGEGVVRYGPLSGRVGSQPEASP